MKYHLSLFLILFSGIAVFGQDSPIIVSLFHPDHNYGETEWEREAFPEIEEVFEGQAFHGVIYEEEPLEAYLKQVLDRILPEELNQFNIRIYIKKAPSFNAGMFMDGRLVLNTGALAAMETEGELAYLMAHELSHFILRHGIRNMRRLDQGLENLSRRRREEEVHDMNTRLALYNQRLETEADSLGLFLLYNAGYSKESALRLLDRLPVQPAEDDKNNFFVRILGIRMLPPSHPKSEERIDFVSNNSLTFSQAIEEPVGDYLVLTHAVRNYNISLLELGGETVGSLFELDKLIEDVGNESDFYFTQLQLAKANLLCRILNDQTLLYRYYNGIDLRTGIITRHRPREIRREYDSHRTNASEFIENTARKYLNDDNVHYIANRLMGFWYVEHENHLAAKPYLEKYLQYHLENEMEATDRRYIQSLIDQ